VKFKQHKCDVRLSSPKKNRLLADYFHFKNETSQTGFYGTLSKCSFFIFKIKKEKKKTKQKLASSLEPKN
jgi:hypothetical protein